MNDGLKEIYQVYDKICKASEQNSSLTVKILRKEYGVQKRDLKVLLEFFYTYYNFFEDYAFDFQIYDSNGCEYNPEETDVFEDEYNCQGTINELKDVENVVNDLMKKIKDDWTIMVKDSVISYFPKLTRISKVNVPASYKKTINTEINKLGSVKVETLNLIDKNQQLDSLHQRKGELIKAILTNKKVMIAKRINNGKIEKKERTPIGLYYDNFLQKYYGVFEDEHTNISEIDVENMVSVQVSDSISEYNREFDIDDYITEMQKYKMVIRVYDEGNVRKKIEALLRDNQLEIQRKEGYYIYTFMSTDEWLYAEKIRQFGRSVIIEEPREIEESMIEEIKDTIELYDQL